MQRWELRASRELALEQLPDPEPADDEVLVDISCSTISPGTELHAYRLGPSDMMTAPGYLAVGVVRTRGAAVTAVDVEQRVVLSAPHASVAVVPGAAVTPVPDGVSDEAASLTHLFGLGHGCLHAGDYRPGEDVAVVGLGLVGMCTALVAQLSGARVHGLDVVPERLEMAARRGLRRYDARSSRLAEEMHAGAVRGPEVIIDTSGSWSGLLTAARIAREPSRICVLGVYRDPPTRSVGDALFRELLSCPARFHYEGLHIIGCSGHPRRAAEPSAAWTLERGRAYLLEAMADGRLDAESLISRHVAPGELPRVMKELDTGDRTSLATVLDWREG